MLPGEKGVEDTASTSLSRIQSEVRLIENAGEWNVTRSRVHIESTL